MKMKPILKSLTLASAIVFGLTACNNNSELVPVSTSVVKTNDNINKIDIMIRMFDDPIVSLEEYSIDTVDNPAAVIEGICIQMLERVINRYETSLIETSNPSYRAEILDAKRAYNILRVNETTDKAIAKHLSAQPFLDYGLKSMIVTGVDSNTERRFDNEFYVEEESFEISVSEALQLSSKESRPVVDCNFESEQLTREEMEAYNSGILKAVEFHYSKDGVQKTESVRFHNSNNLYKIQSKCNRLLGGNQIIAGTGQLFYIDIQTENNPLSVRYWYSQDDGSTLIEKQVGRGDRTEVLKPRNEKLVFPNDSLTTISCAKKVETSTPSSGPVGGGGAGAPR